MKKLIVIPFFLFLFVGNLNADIILPDIFSDHMVLQQKSRVNIWGWSSPGEPIMLKTTFSNKVENTVADSSGRWQITFKTPKAGGPYQLTLQGYSRLILEDVWIGEVWIASGQSNMEMPIDSIAKWYTGVMNYEDEIAKADYPMIREFDVQNTFSKEPQTNLYGQWKVCQPETAGGFSATAYFFARELYNKLNIPVGIINVTWGGTPAQAWMKGDHLNKFDQYNDQIKKMEENDTLALNKNYPSALYNGMIAPVIPYTIAGAIWYQGESNISKAKEYSSLFKQLITGWRNEWDQGDFPFYFVQIAPYDYLSRDWFGGDEYSLGYLIESQAEALNLKNTGMAHTSDIGDLKDIHPKNKQQVGYRLALLALDDVYRKNIKINSGPVFKRMRIKDGKVTISFNNVRNGLSVEGKIIKGFELAGQDRKFYPAEAEIDRKKVIVFSDKVEEPVAVRYAFKVTSEANLFNGKGLPVRPFRTDSW